MTKLKYWFIVLTAWLVFVFNVERLINPVDITKYTYVFVTLVTFGILFVPGIQRIPLWLLTGVPSLLLVLLQIWTNDPVWGAELPITITEICGVVLTGIFATQLSHAFAEFEETVAKIAINYVGASPSAFKDEQGVMYKELKRARLYKRPLSLLTVKLNPDSLEQQLPEMLKTYQRSLTNQMAVATITKMLDRELFDTDIIAQYGGDLIIVLPELGSRDIDKVVQKIQRAVKSNTSFDLEIGSASYPEDATTFESLMDVALERATPGQKTQQPGSTAPVTQTT